MCVCVLQLPAVICLHPPHYREMGGALSPAVGMLTQQSDLGSAEDEEGEEEEGGGAGGGELELMYDPQLNCFYDPNTYKYYELIQ